MQSKQYMYTVSHNSMENAPSLRLFLYIQMYCATLATAYLQHKDVGLRDNLLFWWLRMISILLVIEIFSSVHFSLIFYSPLLHDHSEKK